MVVVILRSSSICSSSSSSSSSPAFNMENGYIYIYICVVACTFKFITVHLINTRVGTK